MLLYQISNRLVCTFYASLCIFGYIILIKNTGKFYYFLTKVTIPALSEPLCRFTVLPPADFSLYILFFSLPYNSGRQEIVPPACLCFAGYVSGCRRAADLLYCQIDASVEKVPALPGHLKDRRN